MSVSYAAKSLSFKALVVEEQETGEFVAGIKTRQVSDLPQGELLIRVAFSGLNYKDALSAVGNKGITRRYPHTPGIDAAGVVVESLTDSFKAGDEVVVTGYDLGMNTSGGFSEYISVPSAWAVRKPQNLSLRDCMIIGTSGFTAASAIYEFLQHGIRPESGKILVTGAGGAVGSMAASMLSNAGFSVVASTGRKEAAEMLLKSGVTEVISRDELNDPSGRPLLPGRWIAALDTVGGNTLSTVIRSTADRGIVANCGMLAGNKLEVSVFPFILRGVRLVGIASAETPMERRLEIWKLIAGKLSFNFEALVSKSIQMDEIPDELHRMLNAGTLGKVLVSI